MIEIKFRPSSHSTDFTVVGTFKSKALAKRVTKQFYGKRRGNRVEFHDYVDCDKDYMEKTFVKDIREFSGENNIKVYTYYQHLRISISVPKTVSENVAMLVMKKDAAELIHKLKPICPPPRIVKQKRCDKLIFEYKGDMIYYYSAPAGERKFFFDAGAEITADKKISVKMLA